MIVKILTFIFGPVVTAILEIRKEVKGLEEKLDSKAVIGDFLHVARNTGFVLVPAFLSGVIYVLLPQGRDTLLLVVEKMEAGNYSQLLFLLIGIVLWSMFAELSVRYAIAITDNSGKSLRDSRVYWRKLSQRMLAAFSLFWPSIMVLLALVWCYKAAVAAKMGVRPTSFIIFALCVYIVFRLLSYFYFQRKKEGGKMIVPIQTRLGARSLPRPEYDWVNRLYGIYNEFVFSLLKPTNFKGEFRKDLQTFADHIVDADEDKRAKIPQNNAIMHSIRVLPAAFEIINKELIVTDKGDSYKWRYRIPNSFFKVFHRQVLLMVAIATVLMVVFAVVPASYSFFGIVGAPALICIAFACYSGIYSGLLFLDYGILRQSFIRVRWLLVLLLLAVSFINKDHPVNMAQALNPPRNEITDQFTAWFGAYKKSMDSVYGGNQKYPVVFICAEGGALRTGAFTGIFLTRLQHHLAQPKFNSIDFKKSIFSMSGVSGGSLGLSYYNAKTFETTSRADTSLQRKEAIAFFKYDCLSPIVGKMFFGEFLNLFIPWHIKRFDRAIALEQTWEKAYQRTLLANEPNRFSENFIDGKRRLQKPVLIINTTEIESGYQCWVANARPDSILYREKRDLLQNKVKQLSYSTAVNFSTRFPLFSPGGKIDTVNGRFHYLDGGYVENTGAGSTLELLEQLYKKPEMVRGMVPIVIYLRFSDNDNTATKSIRFGNELSEILIGAYGTRIGRSFTAIAQLNYFLRHHDGIIVDEPLKSNERDVPMNWALSDQSMNFILKDVNEKLNSTKADGISVRLFQKELRYLPVSK